DRALRCARPRGDAGRDVDVRRQRRRLRPRRLAGPLGGGGPGPAPRAWHRGACWCTGLDSDYGTDSYDTLTFVSYDLTGIADPRLTMVHWYDIDTGAGDCQRQVHH